MAGLSPFNVINFFVTEFAEFSEKHLGKTPMAVLELSCSCQRTLVR